MSNFKPSFTVDKSEYHGQYKPIDFVFPTYRELLRKLRSIMEEHNVHEVCVSRSKRGEWGEWFEYWHLDDGELIKGKEGWM